MIPPNTNATIIQKYCKREAPYKTSQPQKKQRSRRPKRKDTQVPQSSVPSDNVADEAVNKEMDDSLTAQAQEITSLKLRVKKLEKKGGSRTHKLKRLYKVGRSARVISYDEASLGDQEDASKQGRKINDIDKDVEITLVDKTQGRYGDDLMFDTDTTAGEVVTTASVEISTTSPAETTITDDLTLAQTLIEIRSAKPKVKGVVIGEQSESTTRTRPQQLPSKDKVQMQAELEEEDRLVRQKEDEANVSLTEEWDDIQAKIEADHLLAERLQVREQEELTIEERAKLFQQLLEKRRTYFTVKRAEEKRNRPPTQAQQRKIMCTYLKNMEGWKPKSLKNKSYANIQELFYKAMNRVNTFVDYRTELVEESYKKVEVEIAYESSLKRAGKELE
ncbi:hypothetical protein Tco_0817740 [Tanacetum coccineum]